MPNDEVKKYWRKQWNVSGLEFRLTKNPSDEFLNCDQCSTIITAIDLNIQKPAYSAKAPGFGASGIIVLCVDCYKDQEAEDMRTKPIITTFQHVERYCTFPDGTGMSLTEKINKWLAENSEYKIASMCNLKEERVGGTETFIYVIFENRFR